MPHSSGGGSHGGGSHGGHSHSGSHGGSSLPRVSTTRFAGAKRYSYYDRHHVKQYIYCASDPAKAYKPRWALLFFYLPFIIAIGTMVSQSIHIPIKVDNPDSYIYIEDRADIISNESYLSTELSRFYDETGVTPAVLTVYHDEWINYYSSLENYAYEKYVTTFKDEKHWLIVYSVPKTYKSDEFVDWRWEGMIGNDVGSIITSRLEQRLTAQMHKNFLSKEYNIEQAIALAFDDVALKSKESSVDWEVIPVVLFMGGFITFHAIFMVGLTPKWLRYSKAKYDPDPRDLPVTCDYCRSSFVLGDHISCPNCGAPLNIPQQNTAAVSV